MPRQTPFHQRLAEICTSHSWEEWSGYLSATSYELEHIHEYNAVRTSCALFDVSPLYKYYVRGPDAGRLLDRMLTRDVSRCRPGQVLYTAWCDDAGKIIDDGTLARLGDDHYRLTAAIPSLDWLEDVGFGMEVELEDITDETGALALQGPTSRDALQQICEADLSDLRYFRLVETTVAGVPAQVSRTGYTGDLGYEIFVAGSDALKLYDALAEVGEAYDLRPAGNLALEMARIEAGLLLIDVDFMSSRRTLFEVQKSTPFELGLDWLVKLDKEFFIGQEALREEKARGRASSTVGLRIDIQALEKVYAGFGMPLHLPYTAWSSGVPVYSDAERRNHIGKATCGTWSPLLKQYVAIARLDRPHGALGSRVHVELTVETQRFAVPAMVVEMPFFDPPRKRA